MGKKKGKHGKERNKKDHKAGLGWAGLGWAGLGWTRPRRWTPSWRTPGRTTATARGASAASVPGLCRALFL